MANFTLKSFHRNVCVKVSTSQLLLVYSIVGFTSFASNYWPTDLMLKSLCGTDSGELHYQYKLLARISLLTVKGIR